MNLLLVNYMETTAPGGINRVVQEIGAGLVRRGHDVTVLQANPANLPTEQMFNGFKIIRVKSSVARFLYDLNPATYLYLRKNLARLKPDVVHVHGYASLFSWGVMLFLRDITCPVAFSPHYDIQSHDTRAGKYLWDVFNKTIGNHSYGAADKVICASRFESENVKRDFGVAEDRIEVFPHGVARIETSRRPPRNTKHITLVYYGWLLELKGVQYILEAQFKLQQAFGKGTTLSIIGDGNFRSTLSKLARELRIQSSISWYPFLPEEELYERIKAADMCLLLSRSENFGITVAEALALKVPCIVARTTALTEFLDEPGCFGVTYPPDPTELAELIMQVKDDDPDVGPLSDRIRPWDQVVTDYEKLYASLLRETVEPSR
jgi:glycosyltransferase involved in cell wall biosynthesis